MGNNEYGQQIRITLPIILLQILFNSSFVLIIYYSIKILVVNFSFLSISDKILWIFIITLTISLFFYNLIMEIAKKMILNLIKNEQNITENQDIKSYYLKVSLLYMFLILSFLLQYSLSLINIGSYYNFSFYEILLSILFLFWFLFGGFLLDFYKVISFGKSGIYFFIFCVLFAIIDLSVSISLISVILIFYILLVTIPVIISKPNNKRVHEYYIAFQKQCLTFIVIIVFIVLVSLLQIIWAFSDPDSTAYFISARNFIETGSLDVLNQYLIYSNAFLRKFFSIIFETTMRTQYPIGGIYLLSIFMKYAIYWRIMFIIISIIYSIQIYNLFKNFNQESPKPFHLFCVLFLSQTLIHLTTGIGIDFIGIMIALFAINSFMNLINKSNKKEIFNIVFALATLPLIKTTVFVFAILVLFFVIIYTYKTKPEIKISLKNFFNKRKNVLIFSISVIIIIALGIWGLVYSLTGYLEQFDLLLKFIRPFQIPGRTFLNFGINILQLFLIYFIFFFDYFIPKKWREKFNINIKENKRNTIILPIIGVFIVFIFFWNSSNNYPFNIGARYFLIIGLVISVLSTMWKYPKKLKYVLVTYIILSNSAVLFHAAVLDNKNNNFANDVNEILEDSDILVTNYYSKLFPEANVFFGNYDETGFVEKTRIKVEFLLDNNFTVYFIPEGEISFDKAIFDQFNCELIYSLEENIFEKIFFPKIGGLDLLNPAPRELYRLIN